MNFRVIIFDSIQLELIQIDSTIELTTGNRIFSGLGLSAKSRAPNSERQTVFLQFRQNINHKAKSRALNLTIVH